MLIESRNTFALTLLAIVAMVEDIAAVHWLLTVQTSSGPVEGHIASKTSGVSEYLGIPLIYVLKPRLINTQLRVS
jgi:hypothetical protein